MSTVFKGAYWASLVPMGGNKTQNYLKKNKTH